MANANDIFDIMSKTQVRCIWDELGNDVVVYPAIYAEDDLFAVIDDWEFMKMGIAIMLQQGQPHKAIAQNILRQVKELSDF